MENAIQHVFWQLPYDCRRAVFSVAKYKKYKRYKFKKNNVDQWGYSFKGFYEYKAIFVHIPKSGGMSINKGLFGNYGAGHIPVKNYQLFMEKNDFDNFFKFTIVRNPWDRAYSAYNFLKTGGITENDQLFAEKNILPFKDFEDFVLHGFSGKNQWNGLHFTPQHKFVCDWEGNQLVDYIGRFEHLAADYEFICEKLGLGPSNLKHINKTKNSGTYKEAYTPEMKKKIGEVYAKDILLFDYTF